MCYYLSINRPAPLVRVRLMFCGRVVKHMMCHPADLLCVFKLYPVLGFLCLPASVIFINYKMRKKKRQDDSQVHKKENLKSAISDHCKRNNHIMDWDKARIISSKGSKHKHWIRVVIQIRKRAKDTMNPDEGAFMLCHTWDSFLQRPSDGGGGVNQADLTDLSVWPRLHLRAADKDTSVIVRRRTAVSSRNMSW